MKRALLTVTLALTLSVSPGALAAGPLGVGTPVEPPPPTVGLEHGNKRAFWSAAPVGFFASSVIDAGYVYLRPQIAFGWGRPHWHFVQLETAATASAGGLASYGGLRVSIAHLEVRSGMRYQLPFARSFQERAETYDRFDLERRDGPKSRYYAWDSELLVSAPTFRGSTFLLAGAYRIMGVPEGLDLYEEMLRVMMRPSWVYRARLGHAFSLGKKGAIRIGPVAELVYNPGRESRVIRAGLVATVVLTHKLEILATFIPTITSTDRIGLAGGDFGQLGVRYRWGTPEGAGPPELGPAAPPPPQP